VISDLIIIDAEQYKQEAMPSNAELQAAQFVGPLWGAIRYADGPRPNHQQPSYFPNVYDSQWLTTLPLPIGDDQPADQPVALLERVRGEEFERHLSKDALDVAYHQRRRSRVYEDILHTQEAKGSWYEKVAQHLGRLTQSELAVVCTVYQSNPDEEGLGAHVDHWYGAIVQMDGAKAWKFGGNTIDPDVASEHEFIAQAGGILLVPKGLIHDVSTPREPGYSTHITFAICRDLMPTQ
jgi:hypothetical protein